MQLNFSQGASLTTQSLGVLLKITSATDQTPLSNAGQELTGVKRRPQISVDNNIQPSPMLHSTSLRVLGRSKHLNSVGVL